MFLRKLDRLKDTLEMAGTDVLHRGLPFLEVLQCFNQIVEACFGTEMKGDPTAFIEDFKSKYLSLGISVTPKVSCFF